MIYVESLQKMNLGFWEKNRTG